MTDVLKTPRSAKTLAISPKAHHLVRVITLAMYAENYVMEDVCKISGVEPDTFRKWRKGRGSPRLSHLEAVGKVLNLRLAWKPDYPQTEDEPKIRRPRKRQLTPRDPKVPTRK